MREYDKRVFSTNLNRYMAEKGKRPVDICRLLGVSKSTVSSWCHAQKMPRMDKIETLANYFGILKSDLIEEKPTAIKDDELSMDPLDKKIMSLVHDLSPEWKEQLIEQMELILANR